MTTFQYKIVLSWSVRNFMPAELYPDWKKNILDSELTIPKVPDPDAFIYLICSCLMYIFWYSLIFLFLLCHLFFLFFFSFVFLGGTLFCLILVSFCPVFCDLLLSTKVCSQVVLRIQDVYPGSEFSPSWNPDPGSKRFRIRIHIKEFKFCYTKICF